MEVLIFKIALATVGVTEVIKNLVQKGGKRFWTFITLIVGAGMTAIAFLCPEVILTGIVAVSGAVIFYDTIFKSFKKLFEKYGNKEIEE